MVYTKVRGILLSALGKNSSKIRNHAVSYAIVAVQNLHFILVEPKHTMY